VFRTGATATGDAVALARYVLERRPNAKSIAGINQNYAWGQDSWNDFEAAIKVLKPDVQITSSQMPKLLAGQYGAEISALMSGSPDVIHSSFWGGDLDAFVLQAVPRGALRKSTAVLTCGETATHKLAGQLPQGTIIGARGPHGAYAPDNELNRFFRAAYNDRYNLFPNYPAYHMAQALLGLKSAYEKAQGSGTAAPSQEQIIAAFEGLSYETPSGTIKMALGKGHQAIEPTVYGRVSMKGGKLTFTDVVHYPAEKVNPPEGVKSMEWIQSSFKGK
jgi:branched-chain amino acid transport system substrate-binding protein